MEVMPADEEQIQRAKELARRLGPIVMVIEPGYGGYDWRPPGMPKRSLDINERLTTNRPTTLER